MTMLTGLGGNLLVS